MTVSTAVPVPSAGAEPRQRLLLLLLLGSLGAPEATMGVIFLPTEVGASPILALEA